MNAYINAWGGDGFMTAAAVALLSVTGMFEDIPENLSVHVRLLDLKKHDSDRLFGLISLYRRYFSVIFETEPKIIFDCDMSLKGKVESYGTVTAEIMHENSELLSLGLSDDEMKVNMVQSMCGMPWIGEVCYSYADITDLYRDADKDSIVINCGGYRGGGTAAAFIPMECRYGINAKRYNVITGPCVANRCIIKLPYPDIYRPEDRKWREKTEVFEADEMKRYLGTLTFPENCIPQHEENIEYLDNMYKKVKDGCNDYSQTDSKYSFVKFISSLKADRSRVSATFINMKSDGVIPLMPDILESTDFDLSGKYDVMHITHLINALSVLEVLKNDQKFTGGHVYSFGSTSSEKYTPETLFRGEKIDKFRSFFVFSVIVTHLNYALLLKISRDGWRSVKEVKNLKKIKDSLLSEVLSETEKFIKSCICVVLTAFYNIDCLCEQSSIFSLQSRKIIKEIIKTVMEPNRVLPDNITAFFSETMDAFLSECLKKRYTENNLKDYLKNIPKPEDNDSGKDYFNRMIRYAMKNANYLVK